MADYIARQQVLIGAYPLAGFAVVAAPIPVGYGLWRMTHVSDRILHRHAMRGRSLVHEIPHSWWRHGVRIDFASGNWGEGLTACRAGRCLSRSGRRC